MNKPLATIKREGSMLVVAFPYDEPCLDALKDAIPWQERKWDNARKVWELHSRWLETARALLSEHALRNRWRVEDHTLQSPQQIAAERRLVSADTREQHIAAFLALLPQLPRHSLALIGFHRHEGLLVSLELELISFLKQDLFAALRAATLPLEVTRRSTAHPKRGSGPIFQVAADERILHALIERRDVSHLQVTDDLSITRAFDHGVVHLNDRSGRAYVGRPWNLSALDVLNDQATPWLFAVVAGQILLVRPCDELARALLSEPSSGWLWVSGSFAVATTRQSSAALALAGLHLEDWFRTWASDILHQPARRRSSTTPGSRAPDDYEHPADLLLSHFGQIRDGALSHAADLAELLGWSVADITARRERVATLKEAAAEAQIAHDRANAATLAAPLLRQKRKEELLALATRFDLPVKRSANKAALIEALLTRHALCEATIGLAPLLSEETNQSTDRNRSSAER